MITIMVLAAVLMLGVLLFPCYFALSANREVDRFTDQEIRQFPVVALAVIYKGGYVGKNPAGYVKPFVPGDELVGIAYEAMTGGATDGAEKVRVFTLGDFVLPLTSVAQKDVGKPVYATADDTLALTGHFDAFVGRVFAVHATNYAVVRLRSAGETPQPTGEGSTLITVGDAKDFLALAAAGTGYHPDGLKVQAIGAAGAPVVGKLDAEDGGLNLAFSATAEVQTAAIFGEKEVLPVDKGITMDFDFTIHTAADAAVADFDIGLGTAPTANSLADIDHGDMAQLAALHLDLDGLNLYAQSDNATTDVANTDTLVDVVVDTYNHGRIVVRPDGTVEFWVDGARKLSTTAFAVLSTAVLAPFAVLEKTSNDSPGSVYVKNLRVAGGLAAKAA